MLPTILLLPVLDHDQASTNQNRSCLFMPVLSGSTRDQGTYLRPPPLGADAKRRELRGDGGTGDVGRRAARIDHSGLEFSALPLSVCAGLIILSVPLSYYSGVEIGEAIKVKRERAAYILFTYKHRTNTCLEQTVYPHFWGPHNSIKNETAIFENLDYTVFSEPPSEVLSAGSLPGTHCKT
jgi:hypothetical protein